MNQQNPTLSHHIGRIAVGGHEILTALTDELSFDTHNGTLMGRRVDPGDHIPAGRLPDDHRPLARLEWRSVFFTSHIRFVVYSYATPIAWVTEDGEHVIPSVKYSVTTSRHQGRVRAAWASFEIRTEV